jgi:hypothetical protein
VLFPEITENPALSDEEKIARLREIEASIRSLDRALFAEHAADNPWSQHLVEIENQIRVLTKSQ